jgi:POT family proton-dependent oligopeptide transporter
LVAKLAPKRFASLLMGVWFLGNAGGYALTGTLGALLPPTPDKYIVAQKENIDLKKILDGEKMASGKELFVLAQNKIAASIDFEKGEKNNINFATLLKQKDSTITQAQFEIIAKEKLIQISYPKFVGFTLKNLYDFFMLFVVLCGIAGLVLYALSPMLKKMMHGVR